MNIIVTPNALRRIRAEYPVHAPSVEIVDRCTIYRGCCGAHRVQSLIVLAPAYRPDPALIIEVDHLPASRDGELIDGTPPYVGLIEQNV